MKKPAHPQAKAAHRKKAVALRPGAPGAGGSAAAPKAAHPHAKAAKAAKHHAAAKKKQAKAAHKPRKWSPDEDVALCSARAVAEAVRLATGRVLKDAQVLSLYWATASTPDDGQTLTEALSAARPYFQLSGLNVGTSASRSNAVCILGLDLPDGEPHAVAVDIDGTWWSWGEPWQPPADAVIEEAWLVCAG